MRQHFLPWGSGSPILSPCSGLDLFGICPNTRSKACGSVISASPEGVSRTDSQASLVRTALDFLVRDGRAIEEVEGSGSGPVQSRVVRPILQMDLPFIDGVPMATASRITVEEFGSYRAAK